MKYNKMFSREHRAHLVRDGIFVEEYRRTGQTTGWAFKVIGEAMLHPGTAVSCIEPGFETLHMKKHTIQLIERIVHVNGLKFLTINHTNFTIRYDVFTENPWEIV